MHSPAPVFLLIFSLFAFQHHSPLVTGRQPEPDWSVKDFDDNSPTPTYGDLLQAEAQSKTLATNGLARLTTLIKLINKGHTVDHNEVSRNEKERDQLHDKLTKLQQAAQRLEGAFAGSKSAKAKTPIAQPEIVANFHLLVEAIDQVLPLVFLQSQKMAEGAFSRLKKQYAPMLVQSDLTDAVEAKLISEVIAALKMIQKVVATFKNPQDFHMARMNLEKAADKLQAHRVVRRLKRKRIKGKQTSTLKSDSPKRLPEQTTVPNPNPNQTQLTLAQSSSSANTPPVTPMIPDQKCRLLHCVIPTGVLVIASAIIGLSRLPRNKVTLDLTTSETTGKDLSNPLPSEIWFWILVSGGVVVAVILVGGAVCWYCRQHRKKTSTESLTSRRSEKTVAASRVASTASSVLLASRHLASSSPASSLAPTSTKIISSRAAPFKSPQRQRRSATKAEAAALKRKRVTYSSAGDGSSVFTN